MPLTHEQRVDHGRKGGAKVKERLKDDPEYYSRIGKLGQAAVIKKHGRGHHRRASLARLNKKGGDTHE